MTYHLVPEGVRAINPEFAKAYKEYKQRSEAGVNSHPLVGLSDMTPERFQEILGLVGLNDTKKFAVEIGVGIDQARRILKEPQRMTLAQYKTISDKADLYYSKCCDEGRAGEGQQFMYNWARLVEWEFKQAAYDELCNRAILNAYSSISEENRLAIETILESMVQVDCCDTRKREIALAGLRAVKNELYFFEPWHLAEIVASVECDLNKCPKPKKVNGYAEYLFEVEGDNGELETVGTYNELIAAVLDEYTSPREEEMND